MRSMGLWGFGLLGLAALAVIGWALWPTTGNGEPPAPGQLVATEESGGITVRATHTPGDVPARFDVTIETHSVDLAGYDAVAKSSLTQAGGSQALPIELSRTVKNDGHHVSAVLYFDGSPTSPFTLTFRDLGGTPVRALVFQ